MGRAIDEAKESTQQTPSRASTVLGPRGSIRVRGQRSPAGVTPKAKRQKKALVKMKRKELAKTFSKESSVS